MIKRISIYIKRGTNGNLRDAICHERGKQVFDSETTCIHETVEKLSEMLKYHGCSEVETTLYTNSATLFQLNEIKTKYGFKIGSTYNRRELISNGF